MPERFASTNPKLGTQPLGKLMIPKQQVGGVSRSDMQIIEKVDQDDSRLWMR